MKANPKAILLAGIAILGSLSVLLGYFFSPVEGFSASLLRGATLLSAVLLLVGLVNLFRTHWRKFKQGQKNKGYSLVLVISMIATIFVAAPLGPTSRWSLWIYDHVQIPIESSLMGILAIVLVYSCARMLKHSLNIYSLIFIGTVLLVLVGTVSIPGMNLGFLGDLKVWVASVWSVAGARGILLGVGLGSVATGLRVMMAADRPYGG